MKTSEFIKEDREKLVSTNYRVYKRDVAERRLKRYQKRVTYPLHIVKVKG